MPVRIFYFTDGIRKQNRHYIGNRHYYYTLTLWIRSEIGTYRGITTLVSLKFAFFIGCLVWSRYSSGSGVVVQDFVSSTTYACRRCVPREFVFAQACVRAFSSFFYPISVNRAVCTTKYRSSYIRVAAAGLPHRLQLLIHLFTDLFIPPPSLFLCSSHVFYKSCRQISNTDFLPEFYECLVPGTGIYLSYGPEWRPLKAGNQK